MEDKININEAFKELEMIEPQLIYEDVDMDKSTFNLADMDDIEDLKDFLVDNETEDPIQMIVDMDAESELDLKDDYTGDIILQCPVCNEMIYKAESDLEAPEDEEDSEEILYNEGEACPHCKCEKGFKLIGKVAPYVPEGEEVDVEITPEGAEADANVEDDIGADELGPDAEIPALAEDEVILGGEEEVEESLEKPLTEDFHDKTSQGYKVVKRFTELWKGEPSGRIHVIAERTPGLVSDHDYIICLGYHDATGSWEQGRYGYESIEDAENALKNGDGQVGSGYEVIEENCQKEDCNEQVEDKVNEAIVVENKSIEDFNENLFDNLANKYMHEIYENVESYETTSGSIDESNNQIIVEGVIKFKSGKEQATKFIFEADTITKKGKVRLFGLNETFSTAKKAFNLKCTLNGTELLPEALTYNYKTKVLDESKTVYGRVANKLDESLLIEKTEEQIKLEAEKNKAAADAILDIIKESGLDKKIDLSFWTKILNRHDNNVIATIGSMLSGIPVEGKKAPKQLVDLLTKNMDKLTVALGETLNPDDYKMDEIDAKADEHEEQEKALKETFKSDDIIKNLISRAESYISDGYNKEEAVERAIDDGLIYNEDILNLAEVYLDTSKLLGEFYESLYGDLLAKLDNKVSESLNENIFKHEIKIPDGIKTITEDTLSDDCGVSDDDKGKITSVVIPNSVTLIDYNAFGGCNSLKSIIIPDSVTLIGDYAFDGCSSLTSITIPDSVKSIGKGTFGKCSSLKSITIPDSVTSIGGGAFSYCYNLKSIIIPDSVTSIGNYTFSDCISLTSITIPNSVTSIGEYAFEGCYNLTSITIPESVTSIGFRAFAYCDNLTSITIPDSVTSIGKDAFLTCPKLIIKTNSQYVKDYCKKTKIKLDESLNEEDELFLDADPWNTSKTKPAVIMGEDPAELALEDEGEDDDRDSVVDEFDVEAELEESKSSALAQIEKEKSLHNSNSSFDSGVTFGLAAAQSIINKEIDENLDEAIENVAVTTDDGQVTNVETNTEKVELEDNGDEVEVKIEKDNGIKTFEEPAIDEVELGGEEEPIEIPEEPAAEEESEDEDAALIVDDDEAASEVANEFDSKEEK